MIGGKLAHAAITSVSAVGAGVTIELIEVDASGNQVGDAIASATTDASGAYSLTVHSGFSPDSKYVIRATGINESMDVRVTSTSNDIDPVTDAVSDLVTTIAADLSTISVTEITEIRDALDGIAQNVDPAGLTAEALSAALKTEANNDEVFSNQLNSTVAAGSICGTVTNSSGSPLANIRVVAQDFRAPWNPRSFGRGFPGRTKFSTMSITATEYFCPSRSGTERNGKRRRRRKGRLHN